MDHIYQFQFKDEFFTIFKSKVDHKNESTLIAEMVATLKQSRLHLVEIQIKMIFDKFETKNHESKYWHDNLKTLLAHGFDIFNSSNNSKLTKSFEPIEFNLYAEATKSYLHYGFFYKEVNQTVTEQFIRFCQVTEYPPGINEQVILGVLMNDGGSLSAKDGHATTVLIQRNPLTDTITGSNEVIKFLSTPVKQHVG